MSVFVRYICVLLLGVLIIAPARVHTTAVVTNYIPACKNTKACDGKISFALTADSISDGAKISLQVISEGDELLETQDWIVDPLSNHIYLNDHPNLVIAKYSLFDSKVVLRDTRKIPIFSLGEWDVQVDKNGFWSFRQNTFVITYLTVYGGSDGLRVEAQPSPNGCVQFFSYDPIPTFDYVVVGGGTAGAKVAKLLSDNHWASVALLEAGIRQDDDAFVSNPQAVRSVESSAVYNFPYFSSLIANLGNQRFTTGVGKMWGGTSNHNGMLYDRGLRYDWDSYAKYSGSQEWTYDSIQDIYTQQENYTGVTAGFGNAGEIDIVDSHTYPAPAADPVINATQKVWPGFVPVGSLNGNVKVGCVTKFELTQKNLGGGSYIREGSSRAYLNEAVVDPVTGKGVGNRRLTIFSRSFASKLIFHRKQTTRAVGVEYITHDKCMKVLARREVILSAGAFNSPALLMRSGVGNCTYLATLNISCVYHNPSVGQNLQDHTRVQMAVGLPAYITPYIAETVSVRDTDGHLMEGRVITDVAESYTDKTVTNETQADTKFSLVYTLQSPTPNLIKLFNLEWVQGNTPVQAPIIEFAGILLRPKCAGNVRIVSPLPLEVPEINHNYLCHPDDKAWAAMMFKDFIQIVDNLKQIDPVYSAKFPTKEMVNDNTTFQRILPVLVNPYRHPCGSLRMGKSTDPTAVVSPRLCAYGLSGVRVADASVFPVTPSNNPQSAVYVVGGLAARFIKSGISC